MSIDFPTSSVLVLKAGIQSTVQDLGRHGGEIALPFLIQQHHASPAPLVAIGMLSGYCGTLMTPMAANFNIIPAALLELKDKYQVIKYRIPTAIAVLICNIILMYFLI